MPLVLAGLPAVGAGLMALALLFGAVLLADALLRSIDVAAIPGLIGDMFRIIAHGIARAAQWIGSLFASIARGALSVFVAPAAGFVNSMTQVVWAVGRFGNWIRWLVHTAVPQLWSGLFSAVASAVNNLVSFATGLFNQAMTALNNLRAYLERLTYSVAASVAAYALSLSKVLMATLTGAVNSLTAFTQSLYRASLAALAHATTALVAYILSIRAQMALYAQQLTQWGIATATGISIDWARKYADWLIDQYNRALAGATAIAMAPAWPTVLEAIDSISLALPESVAAVLQRIGAIPRSIPRDLALEIGAVAAVGSIAIDWVARCGLSLCRNTKDFGDELAALGDALLIAELIEMIVEARRDPHGAAGDAVSELTGPLMELGDNIGDIMLAMI